MEGKEQDMSLGANKFQERQPIWTAAQSQDGGKELTSWSFYKAWIGEFVATFLFLYITILIVMGVRNSKSKCTTVGIQGIVWAFSDMIFYCTAGISGGLINPEMTFGLFLARKLSLMRVVLYIVMQFLGAICGAGVVKGFEGDARYNVNGGGANAVNSGYIKRETYGVAFLQKGGCKYLTASVFSKGTP